MRVGAKPDHEKIGQIFGQEVLEFECNYCQAVFLIIKNLSVKKLLINFFLHQKVIYHDVEEFRSKKLFFA